MREVEPIGRLAGRVGKRVYAFWIPDRASGRTVGFLGAMDGMNLASTMYSLMYHIEPNTLFYVGETIMLAASLSIRIGEARRYRAGERILWLRR